MNTDGESRWARSSSISLVAKLRATPLCVVSTTASGAVSATTLTMSSGSRLMPQSMTWASSASNVEVSRNLANSCTSVEATTTFIPRIGTSVLAASRRCGSARRA